jgi:hypothetical protein
MPVESEAKMVVHLHNLHEEGTTGHNPLEGTQYYF